VKVNFRDGTATGIFYLLKVGPTYLFGYELSLHAGRFDGCLTRGWGP